MLVGAVVLAIASLCAERVGAQPGEMERLHRYTFADLAEQVSPSVATVEVWVFVPNPSDPEGPAGRYGSRLPVPLLQDEPDDDAEGSELPGRRPPANERGGDRGSTMETVRLNGGYVRAQSGSGVVVSEDGVVVTSLHLVGEELRPGAKLRVVLADGREFQGGDEIEFVGIDNLTDLAVLRLRDTSGLPALPWGDSEAMRLGEWVMVIGNPLNFELSLSEGILSGKHRRVDSDELQIEDLLQTTAVINAGNSGGALVDLDGRLIGIVTAIATTGEAWQGLGFAMPEHIARPVVDSLVEHGYVRRGYLGVSMSRITLRGPRDRVGPPRDGVAIEDVIAGYPAETAGLRSGDVLREIDGRPITVVDDVIGSIATRSPGDSVRVLFDRDGAAEERMIALAEWPQREQLIAARVNTLERESGGEGSLGWSGGESDDGAESVDDDNQGAAEGAAPKHPDVLQRMGIVAMPRLGDARGLVVMRVRDGSPAAVAGLRDGDLLVEADGAVIEGITPLRARLSDAEKRGSVSLRVDRAGVVFRLDVPLTE